MGATDALVVQLQLRGCRCVVVGGGGVAARRTRSLLAAGAVVIVVAPTVDPVLAELAARGELALLQRKFRTSDLDPVDGDPADGGAVRLVVAATDDAEVNELVGRVAAGVGALVNRADDAAAGDVSFPSTFRRGPVTVAVSTGSVSPVAARWVAERLDDACDEALGLDAAGLELLVEVLAEVRAELSRPGRVAERGPATSAATEERGVTPGTVDWRSALDGTILELIHQGRRAEAKERLLACLSS